MNKDSRIAIIGGGPAGISMAYYLEKKGFMNYQVLEKLDHVGGKCNSPLFRGKRYDMGAILGAPSYDVLNEMMSECGITPDGEKLYAEMRDYLTGEITNLTNQESRAVLKELRVLKKVLGENYPNYDCVGHLGTHPDLMENFDDFCTKYEITTLKKLFINPFTSFGYGFLEETPTAYVLKYLDLATLNYFLKEELWSINDGTQSIWERISDKLTNSVMLNVDIKSIEYVDGKNVITTNLGVMEYDYVVFTSPLDHLKYYTDTDSQLVELFDKIETVDYKVFAVTLKNYPTKTCYIQGNMNRVRCGHSLIYFVKWANDPDQVVTIYVIGDKNQGISDSECKALISKDMEIMGFPIKDFILEKNWYYFPHVSSEVYKSGFYDKLEGLQGTQGRFFAGEVMSFGDMEETSAYSKQLVERFFN